MCKDTVIVDAGTVIVFENSFVAPPIITGPSKRPANRGAQLVAAQPHTASIMLMQKRCVVAAASSRSAHPMLRAAGMAPLRPRFGAAASPHAAAPRTAGARARVVAAAGAGKPTAALIFDCDGVIVETEELHRRAYNGAFEAFGIAVKGAPCVWDTKYYDMLQNTVAGGKGKMKYHFNNNGWEVATKAGPVAEGDRDKLVDDLQDQKTEVYKRIVEEAAEARPGVIELMEEALARPDIALCICSAATKAGFEKVTNSIVKPERLARFDLILAGDDVKNKKPDPDIYNTARERLGIPADRCLVIEDSMVGLRAARGAGMHCIITPTSSTEDQPFCEEGAAAVVKQLAGPGYRVRLDDLFAPMADGSGATVNLQGMSKMEGNECVVTWSAAAAAANKV
ncbi:MAG: HAD-like domain-containing protein [Monoraphidium minutum]|nr:MAG: HAD-like domain-containing protein [Monoraphidium minutum]